MEDSKIIELFFERSEQAIVELSSKYERFCYKIAFNILKNEDDIMECINDAYLRVWNTVPPNVPDNLMSYLALAVRNIALDKLEFNTAQKRGMAVDCDLEEVLNYMSDSQSMDELLDERRFQEVMNEFLEGLDKVGRIIFVKRYYYCCSIGDISESIKMSVPNVSMKLSRTRKKLKKFLLEKGITV